MSKKVKTLVVLARPSKGRSSRRTAVSCDDCGLLKHLLKRAIPCLWVQQGVRNRKGTVTFRLAIIGEVEDFLEAIRIACKQFLNVAKVEVSVT